MVSTTLDKDKHAPMIIRSLIVANDSVGRRNRDRRSEISLVLALAPFKLRKLLPAYSRIRNTKNSFDRRTGKPI